MPLRVRQSSSKGVPRSPGGYQETMLRFLFPIFILLPLLEIWLLLRVGEEIGVLATIAAVVATAIIGVYWLKMEGFATLGRLQGKLASGQLPAVEMVEGVLLLIAGAFLLTPGFATDAVGFTLLLPQGRASLARWMQRRIVVVGAQNHSGPEGPPSDRDSENPHRDPTVIEGEFSRITDKD